MPSVSCKITKVFALITVYKSKLSWTNTAVTWKGFVKACLRGKQTIRDGDKPAVTLTVNLLVLIEKENTTCWLDPFCSHTRKTFTLFSTKKNCFSSFWPRLVCIYSYEKHQPADFEMAGDGRIKCEYLASNWLYYRMKQLQTYQNNLHFSSVTITEPWQKRSDP